VLAEAAGDVIFGSFFFRVGKDAFGGAELDQFA